MNTAILSASLVAMSAPYDTLGWTSHELLVEPLDDDAPASCRGCWCDFQSKKTRAPELLTLLSAAVKKEPDKRTDNRETENNSKSSLTPAFAVPLLQSPCSYLEVFIRSSTGRFSSSLSSAVCQPVCDYVSNPKRWKALGVWFGGRFF